MSKSDKCCLGVECQCLISVVEVWNVNVWQVLLRFGMSMSDKCCWGVECPCPWQPVSFAHESDPVSETLQLPKGTDKSKGKPSSTEMLNQCHTTNSPALNIKQLSNKVFEPWILLHQWWHMDQQLYATMGQTCSGTAIYMTNNSQHCPTQSFMTISVHSQSAWAAAGWDPAFLSWRRAGSEGGFAGTGSVLFQNPASLRQCHWSCGPPWHYLGVCVVFDSPSSGIPSADTHRYIHVH